MSILPLPPPRNENQAIVIEKEKISSCRTIHRSHISLDFFKYALINPHRIVAPTYAASLEPMPLNPNLQDGVGFPAENARDGGSFYAKLHVEGRKPHQIKTLSLGVCLGIVWTVLEEWLLGTSFLEKGRLLLNFEQISWTLYFFRKFFSILDTIPF